MERADLDRIERVITHELTERFGVDTVQRAVVLQYGDDPAIGPGQLLVRAFIPAPGAPAEYEQALAEWEQAHRSGIEEMRRELSLRLPSAKVLEFTFDVPGAEVPRISMPDDGTLADRADVGARDRHHRPLAAPGQLRVPRARRAGGRRGRGQAGGRRVRRPGRDHPHRAPHHPPKRSLRRQAPAGATGRRPDAPRPWPRPGWPWPRRSWSRPRRSWSRRSWSWSRRSWSRPRRSRPPRSRPQAPARRS